MSKKKTNLSGARTKYDEKLIPLIFEAADRGYSVAEIAEACGVQRRTLDRWRDTVKGFDDVYERAIQKAQVWYEKKGRSGLDDTKFNGNLWCKQVKHKFKDYQEVSKVEVDATINQGVSKEVVDILNTISVKISSSKANEE